MHWQQLAPLHSFLSGALQITHVILQESTLDHGQHRGRASKMLSPAAGVPIVIGEADFVAVWSSEWPVGSPIHSPP